MKIILENQISAVSADSEDSEYVAENVLDDSPKKLWKSDGDDTATLTCSASGEIDTIAIFNTNADSISMLITDPNEFEWQNLDWQNLAWQETDVDITVNVEAQADSSAVWGTFEGLEDGVILAITLSAATGTTVQAGIVVIGAATDIKDPQYGIIEGLYDYSIERELSNGALYYKQRDIVRSFSCSMLLARDPDFYTFMHTYARAYGKAPKAFRITDENSFKWVVYARLMSMPSGWHQHPRHSPVSIELIEVL